jgi:hypothetical protein
MAMTFWHDEDVWEGRNWVDVKTKKLENTFSSSKATMIPTTRFFLLKQIGAICSWMKAKQQVRQNRKLCFFYSCRKHFRSSNHRKHRKLFCNKKFQLKLFEYLFSANC